MSRDTGSPLVFSIVTMFVALMTLRQVLAGLQSTLMGQCTRYQVPKSLSSQYHALEKHVLVISLRKHS